MLTIPFNTPFFEAGTGSAAEVPAFFPAAIGGHSYLLDLDQYERQSLDVIRQQADQARQPSEQSFSPFSLWRRSIESWHHGAGQINFDLGDESDPARFRSSKGVDPWTAGVLTLLPATSEKLSTTAASLKIAVAGARIYVLDGNAVKFTTDITAATPTFTTVTGTPAATPTSITSDGYTVWIAYPTAIFSTNTDTAAATSFSANPADLVVFCNGRLLMARANVLNEVSKTGVLTILFTHFTGTFVWDTITPAPNAIYATGHAGTRGDVYRLAVNEASSSLSSVFAAAALPDGEYVTAMLAYVGVVVLGTNRGVRLASSDNAGNLQYGVLIPTGLPVQALEGDDRFVWFGWSNVDTVSTGLGRLDLSVFTDTLRPAFASDLMVTGQGAVTDCVTFQGRRVFAVAGDGYFVQDTNRVPSGSVDSGLIRWGTTERKVVHSVDMRTLPLPAGGTVKIELAGDAGTFDSVSTVSAAGNTGPTSPYSTRNTATEQAEVRLTLTRATVATVSPTVLRATVKSLVSPPRTEQIVAPIVMFEQVEAGGGDGQFVRFNTAREFAYLKGLEQSGLPVAYQEGLESWTVIVERVAVRPTSWTRDRAWLNGLCIVTMRTVEG